MKRDGLTRTYLKELGYPYDDNCVMWIVMAWEKDHEEQLVEEEEFEIDEEDVKNYWFSYIESVIFGARGKKMMITKMEQKPKDSQWSYPLSEIPYLLEQIEDGDREEGCEFLLFVDRLYETQETNEW